MADLFREAHDNEALPIEIRRCVVQAIEALDLARYHIRQATLATIIDKPPTKWPGPIKRERAAAKIRPAIKRAKGKRT
jgi:hypothetical protein